MSRVTVVALRLAFPENAPGEFYVDRRCIDCDNCRSLAPQVFVQKPPTADADGYAYVRRQPASAEQRRLAIAALAVCPVQCIGSRVGVRRAAAAASFPMVLEAPVAFLGQASEKSYGGKAYVATLPFGNVLFDAPRWDRHLRTWLAERGGVAWIFLSHRDDVADAPRYADHFGAHVLIGAADADAYRGSHCRPLAVEGPIGFGDYLVDHPIAGVTASRAEMNRLQLLPTPGHTAGHFCFRLDERFLFAGDHVAVNRLTGRPYAFRRHCWYDWERLQSSVRLLLDYPCEWLLPAHGRYGRFPWSELRPMLAAVAEHGAA
jgi:glyoxylase-like metal-dependent hydrolase (beta-lactamase superfamily II)/ferredoxin